MERVILHCDMNNFFASVECKLDPSIKDLPVAVCGDQKERHGIVLAKNEIAKKYGIKTGETIWQAKMKCKDLYISSPPHFDEYHYYSRKAKEIYLRYTDLVESFGIDECWLDVTRSQKLFGNGEKIANELRETIKKELGLTISVGVSYNKIFAKLGSDMKKPDGTTVITRENFKEKVWPLPASDLFGVGRNVKLVLDEYFIKTIGDIANTRLERLQYILGKSGEALYEYANGEDDSEVSIYDEEDVVKSIGHGTTTRKDIENDEDVWKLMLALTDEIGEKLRNRGLKARGVSIVIKDNTLQLEQFQKKLLVPTQSAYILAKEAYNLYLEKYYVENPIRSITVTAINLVEEDDPIDRNLFVDLDKINKIEKVEKVLSELKEKYGEDIVTSGTLMKDDDYISGYIKEDLPTPATKE